MTPTLYFLRSSEAKIVTDMLQYAHPELDDAKVYSEFYGLTNKDLGLYALVEHKIAGAIWSRIIDNVPLISLGILPEFEDTDLNDAMMQQFLVEAAALYETMLIHTYTDSKRIEFLKKHDFQHCNDAKEMMQISLEKKEIIRPTDGYDARKWMD